MNDLFEANVLNWILILIASFIIGLSKAGLKGIDMLNVTLMALVFGGKQSTGIILPLLCFADIMAVKHYHRHVQWSHFWKLMPWMLAGVVIGVFTGKDLNEMVFRRVMAIIIVATAIIIILLEIYKHIKIPTNPFFTATMGLSSGFTTMIGNLAGAFSNIYFLAMRLPKNEFIGTGAWVFLAINLIKVPFQVFAWHNINGDTLLTDLALLPALVVGFVAGLQLVKHIKDDSYRKVVIALTLVGAVFIFLK